MRPLRLLAAALVVVIGCGGVEAPTAPPSSATPSSTTGAVAVPGVEPDLDGDGVADTVAIEGSEEDPTLVVRLGSGGSASLRVDPSPVLPEVESVTPVDGGTLVVVRVGRGASTDLYGLYTWDGTLVSVTLPGGVAAVFPVGASATHVSGVSCDGALAVLSAESADGETFTTTEVGYRLDGAVLVEESRRTGTARLGDPILAPEVAC